MCILSPTHPRCLVDSGQRQCTGSVASELFTLLVRRTHRPRRALPSPPGGWRVACTTRSAYRYLCYYKVLPMQCVRTLLRLDSYNDKENPRKYEFMWIASIHHCT